MQKKSFPSKLLSLLFIFLFTVNYLGQNIHIETSKIHGINESIISDVEQDIHGFIWIASDKSIYKYNNTDLINYPKKELNLKTHHSIINIVSDANGNIWYFPKNDFDLQILNTKKNKAYSLKEVFPNLPFLESDIINEIYRDDDYNIYISVKNKGLYKFNGKKIVVVKLINQKNNHPIYFINSKHYNWFGFNKTIIKQNKATLFEEDYKVKLEILSANIFNNQPIFIQSIGFEGLNSQAISISNNKIVYPLKKFKLQNNYFNQYRIFQKINNNNYWINEKDYLTQIDRNKKITFKIEKNNLPFGKRYRAFFIDRNNIIWVITQTSLYKVVLQKNNFKKYLEGYSLKSIFKKDSIFYISAFGASLKELSNKNIIKQSKRLPKPYSFFGTVYNKDTLWAARYSRALRYIFKTNTVLDYKRGAKIDNEEVGFGAMARHPKTKTIFIGSLKYLNKIDEESQTTIATNYLDKFLAKKDRDKINVRCFATYGDSLWIGTAKGLFLMDHEEKITRAITTKNGLPKNINIQYIYIENSTTFWLGTQGKGLIKWDRLKNTFKTFTTKDGLSNNNVYAIFKDQFGFFWLPTDNGLNRFAPKTLKNSIFLPNQISHKEFNHLSHFQDKDGMLYLGSINGVNVFNPKDFLTVDNTAYNLVVDNTKTKLNNNSITINSENLKPELEFLLLDFKNNSPLQYQYKITPLHDDFVVAKGNKIIIPNLKKGKYQLHVKAQSSDGKWASLKKPILINSDFKNYLFLKIILLLSILFSMTTVFIIRRKKAKKETDIPEEPKTSEENKINLLSNTKQDDWLNQLKETILHNMNSVNFGMEFLSDKMELSERQLQRRIKNLTDLTPNKYITEVKLNEAFRLIEEKEVDSVKELSIKVGYATPDYFSKLFQKKFGKKPSEFLNF